MAKPGPQPVPSELKRLKGNPGHRPISDDEPKPLVSAGVPEPPDWLEPYAKNIWGVLAPELHRLGLLTVLDLTTWAAYCQSYARWRTAEEWLTEHEETIELLDKKNKLRNVIRASACQTSREALADMNRFGSQFGLSPSARTSIHAVPTTKVQNKFAQLR